MALVTDIRINELTIVFGAVIDGQVTAEFVFTVATGRVTSAALGTATALSDEDLASALQRLGLYVAACERYTNAGPGSAISAAAKPMNHPWHIDHGLTRKRLWLQGGQWRMELDVGDLTARVRWKSQDGLTHFEERSAFDLTLRQFALYPVSLAEMLWWRTGVRTIVS